MKLRVYVQSFEFPTVGFVDKEGAMHACAQAQKTAFQGLQHFSGLFGNRYLTDEEREVLARVEDFCKNKGLEFQIIDLGTMNFLSRLKLKMKGLETPAICCGATTLYGVPSDEDLKGLLRSWNSVWWTGGICTPTQWRYHPQLPSFSLQVYVLAEISVSTLFA